ncbi:MAG: hypothetical protein KDA75_02115 [Planctomycetaceae bacterium]|nr:hypothetical protein [Planctomycetaceae bacterium]
MVSTSPILAAFDPGMIVWVAVAIIWFVGWVSRMAGRGQAEQPGPGGGPRRRPQNKKIRDEIEAFLEEATGQRRQRPKMRGDEEVELLSADDVEVLEPARRRPRPQRPEPRRPKPQRPAPQTQSPAQPAARSAPGQDLSSRHVPEYTGSDTLQKYVQSHMAERIAAQATRDVGPSVDNSVAQHFGGGSRELSGDAPLAPLVSRPTTPAAAELLKLLRKPESVRQAYILSEVFKPPISRRRKPADLT